MFKPFQGLSKEDLDKIKRAYPLLRQMQNITNVPWQAIAGYWYREGMYLMPPKTPGGPWQFDPVPSRGTLKGLLDRFTKLQEAEKNAILDQGVNDFFAGGILAACFFRTKTPGVIHPDCPDETIKDALWGYNGKSYGSADHSSYVMNGFDEAHFPMHFMGTEPDGKDGRKKVSFLDHRPGAFTVYKQLKAMYP